MQGFRYILFVCALLASSAQAGEPTPLAPLEFWIYRPTYPLQDITSESPLANPVFGSNPKTTAVGAVGKVQVKGVRWEDDCLRLASFQGGLVTPELKSEASSPLGNILLFSYRDIRIDVASKHEIAISFPEKLVFRMEHVEGRSKFVLADDGLKQHLESQIDALLSDAEFDKHFTLTLAGKALPELVRGAAQELINRTKPQLLSQARASLKKSLGPEELYKKLVIDTASLPPGIATENLRGDWLLRRYETTATPRGGAAQRIVLWRLAPVDAPDKSAYHIPNIGLETRNLMTAVISPELVQSLIEAGAHAPSPKLGVPESLAVSKIFGFSIAADHKLEVVSTGERGPKIALWSRATSTGSQNFGDLLWCLQEPSGVQHHLGLVLELDAKHSPRLVAAFARTAEGGWRAVEAKEHLELLKILADQKLDSFYGPWKGGSDRLVPMGLRYLGDGGKRQGVGTWAQAMAFDFQMR